MELLRKYPYASQAALSHLVLRILCLLIVEYDCARLVQQSSGMNAVAGNYALASLFGTALIFALINKKIGFIIGMIAGTINVIAKVVIVFAGHEHYPYWPIVWITQSSMVIYFCYEAYKLTAIKQEGQM